MAKVQQITNTELAAKIETNASLTPLERQAAGAILRDYERILESRRAGGKKGGKKGSPNAGRKLKKNPSPSALYQRERRKKIKEAENQKGE